MLNIGDFARYSGVSVRMLRHYDAIGLLVPSQVDPSSGYRSYDPKLLARVHTIVALRDLGFSLAQIGTLLAGGLSAGGLQGMLTERRRELASRIEADRARLAEVERRLRLIEGETTMELEFTTKSLPALTLSQLTGHVDDVSELHDAIGPLFGRLHAALNDAGRRPEGPAIAWYAGDPSGMDFGVGYALSGVPGTEPTRLDAVERAVATVYRGSVEHLDEAWQALSAHVQQQGHDLGSPGREVYLEVDPDRPEAWVTELQLPLA